MSTRAAGTVASVEEIRSHFPALRRTQDGQPVAYFDGPGGTQVPQEVVDAMADYLLHHNANTHWVYPTSQETDQLLLDARAAIADFLGADADEIAFGQNMTTLTFHIARALGRAWGPDDEIVITDLDHHANVAPWRALARERGVVIRQVPIDLATGRLNWNAFERLIGERTRLVAVGAASNALGTVSDVARATALAHSAGAMCYVDAVHFAPHHLVDVKAIDCDFLACSAYKFYGPHVGILYGKRERLAALDLPKLEPSPDTVPERVETGTLNHEGIVGAMSAVNFLASLAGDPTLSRREALTRSMAELHARGDALARQLWDGLQAIPGVHVYGPPAGTPRTPTVSFTLDGRSTDQIASALAAQGLYVSNGDFYAATVVERYGLADGLVRIGCSCYTTAGEVTRLLDGIRALA